MISPLFFQVKNRQLFFINNADLIQMLQLVFFLLAAHIMIGLSQTMNVNLLHSVQNGQQQLC